MHSCIVGPVWPVWMFGRAWCQSAVYPCGHLVSFPNRPPGLTCAISLGRMNWRMTSPVNFGHSELQSIRWDEEYSTTVEVETVCTLTFTPLIMTYLIGIHREHAGIVVWVCLKADSVDPRLTYWGQRTPLCCRLLWLPCTGSMLVASPKRLRIKVFVQAQTI